MRIRKRKIKSGFTVVKNVWINDKRLSAKAKGIMIYLCYLPENWTLYASELQKHFTDGKDSIKTGLDELIQFGYLVKSFIKRNDENRFRSYDYVVIEDPSCPEEEEEEEEDGCGKSDAENPAIPNKDIADSLNSSAKTNTSYFEELEASLTNREAFIQWCKKTDNRRKVYENRNEDFPRLVKIWKEEYDELVRTDEIPLPEVNKFEINIEENEKAGIRLIEKRILLSNKEVESLFQECIAND
jgi:hypothetical protein